MKKILNSVLVLVVFFTAVSLFSFTKHSITDDWTPEPGFTSLFNGNDLSGWCFRVKSEIRNHKPGDIIVSFDGVSESNDDGRYSAKDGILTVNFPNGQERLISKMYTVAEFPENFV